MKRVVDVRRLTSRKRELYWFFQDPGYALQNGRNSYKKIIPL